VLLVKSDEKQMEYSVGRGFASQEEDLARMPIEADLSELEMIQQFTVRLPDTTLSESHPQLLTRFEPNKFAGYFSQPLIANGQVKGVLEIFFRTPFQAGKEWLEFFNNLSAQTGVAIDNAELLISLKKSNEELVLAYDATIEGWSRTLDLRDNVTEDHTLRTADLTVKLAETMGVTGEALVHIRRGALLHDIGKMAVPDSILKKPNPLTEDEWEIMRKHPEYAFDLLEPISFLRTAVDIPFCHHERWDGTGYPRSLRGEEIPLAARIFSVVDVWDALNTDRPYRQKWIEKETFRYISDQAGLRFDPTVIAAFFKLMGK